MAKSTETYKCQACDHEFKAPPGPVNEGCHACGHPYLKWLTYEQNFGSGGK